jgi:hypothetical protein
MTSQAWIQLVVYMALMVGLGWPLGRWMAAVAEGRFPRWMSPFVKIENALYRLAGVDPASSTGWKTYTIALIVYALQWARSPRRRRSRCSAPTAAASSTPTPRIRSRTRRADQLHQMLSILLIRRR